jgi:hypothetical protein
MTQAAQAVTEPIHKAVSPRENVPIQYVTEENRNKNDIQRMADCDARKYFNKNFSSAP